MNIPKFVVLAMSFAVITTLYSLSELHSLSAKHAAEGSHTQRELTFAEGGGTQTIGASPNVGGKTEGGEVRRLDLDLTSDPGRSLQRNLQNQRKQSSMRLQQQQAAAHRMCQQLGKTDSASATLT